MIEKPIIFDLFSSPLGARLEALGEIGLFHFHEFPDQEILFTVESSVENRAVIMVASLNQPNCKILPLLFAAETLRALGAKEISLLAPYLAYMRQDKAFHVGQGVTSKYFADLISTYFDRLITIDPHLHRWHSLNDIYTIPTQLLHAAPSIAAWIKKEITRPVLIGPDNESSQWVSEIAHLCKAPYLIGDKIRQGNEVTLSIPKLELYVNYTALIIDDIIASGVTMLQAIHQIQSHAIESVFCIGIHALFTENAYEMLLQSGVKGIVTCNTVTHVTNKIDLSPLIISSCHFSP